MKLWKFGRGYVKIRIMGEYPERLVNRCIEAGVPLRDAKRTSREVEAVIRARDMFFIRRAARGTGCKAKLVSRSGAARLNKWLMSNAVFAAALGISAAACAFLSTRLWFVSVKSIAIPKQEIIASLEELGASVGKPRNGFDTAALAAAINSDPRCANAKVVLKGVTLSIEVDGLYPTEPDEPETAPAHVIAAKDCVVTSISVSSGQACVKRGEAVKKGDILITGDLSDKKEGHFVRAAGVVMGEVLYRVSATAEPMREELVETGRRAKVNSASLFGMELLLEKAFSQCRAYPERSAVFTACPVPIRVTESDVRELIWGSIPDSREGVIERAKLMAQEKLKAYVPEGARILTARWETDFNADGSVTAALTVTVSENIGIIGSIK